MCMWSPLHFHQKNQRCTTFTMSKSNLPQTEAKATGHHFKYVRPKSKDTRHFVRCVTDRYFNACRLDTFSLLIGQMKFKGANKNHFSKTMEKQCLIFFDCKSGTEGNSGLRLPAQFPILTTTKVQMENRPVVISGK